MRAIVSPRLAVVALAIGALCAGGCGKTRSVDDAQVEQGIETSLSTSSAKVTAAECPTDGVVEKGDPFPGSVASSEGGPGKATVPRGGAGNYSYALKPGPPQIPGSPAEAAVEKSLAAQSAPGATVNCPDT